MRDIRAADVQAWHYYHPQWSENTKIDATAVLLACLNWAAKPEQRLITSNPIAGMKRGMIRSRGESALLSPEMQQKLFDEASPELQQVLTILKQTGMRTGEVIGLTAEQCDFNAAVIRLKEHKTEHRTGRTRVIPMTAVLVKLLQPLCEKHATKEILRRRNGDQWNIHRLGEAFRRLRERLGLPKGVVAYCYRHTAATELLEAGVPDAKVAAILGHTNTAMIYKHYAHVGSKIKSLRDDMERVFNASEGTAVEG